MNHYVRVQLAETAGGWRRWFWQVDAHGVTRAWWAMTRRGAIRAATRAIRELL